jgi:CubicO group peptidase (beta-lactamase class C family)
MDTDKLDTVLREIVADWGIPGLGLGIVEEDAIVFARGYGTQNLDTGAPVTPDSIFCVGSVTKCFVATAVMRLVEQGAVELDAPVVRYLPYFRIDDERGAQITLRQILSHTSGMPDMDEIEYDELLKHPETDDAAAERYVRALTGRRLVADPGARFAYSNIAYNVLGDLIAKVSKQTFESYMREHILRPAGMPESTLLPAEVDPGKLAFPHLRIPEMVVNPVYPYHRADAPASFLHTSVVDMCHWCLACLSQGKHTPQPLLTPESYELMWTPAASRGYPPLYESAGLGWTLGHFDGVNTVSHGGGGFGWTSFLVLLPERRRGAIVLCNEESSAHSRVTDAVIRTMLDEEPVTGSVSWMVPICRALQLGGIQAAHACYADINDSQEYSFDPEELHTLVYQLISVERLDLAIDVLRLNLLAFPKHAGSYVVLARLHMKKGDYAQALEALQEARAIAPSSLRVAELLAQVQRQP